MTLARSRWSPNRCASAAAQGAGAQCARLGRRGVPLFPFQEISLSSSSSSSAVLPSLDSLRPLRWPRRPATSRACPRLSARASRAGSSSRAARAGRSPRGRGRCGRGSRRRRRRAEAHQELRVAEGLDRDGARLEPAAQRRQPAAQPDELRPGLACSSRSRPRCPRGNARRRPCRPARPAPMTWPAMPDRPRAGLVHDERREADAPEVAAPDALEDLPLLLAPVHVRVGEDRRDAGGASARGGFRTRSRGRGGGRTPRAARRTTAASASAERPRRRREERPPAPAAATRGTGRRAGRGGRRCSRSRRRPRAR